VFLSTGVIHHFRGADLTGFLRSQAEGGASALLHCDKARRHAATCILGDLLPEISVKRLGAAIERRAIVLRRERFYAKRRTQVLASKSRRRANARWRAGTAFGGSIRALAKIS